MDNGRTNEVISQFNRISKLPDVWDHNRYYHKVLLKQINSKKHLGLDIGCGTGELTRKLSGYCNKVIGIDVSPSMIDEACKRNGADNIFFMNRDVESFLEEIKDRYDVIVSVATFHHLNMETVLEKLKQKLNPGGMILILDLYKVDTLFEFILSIIATLCNPLMNMIKRRRLFITKAERQAWREHCNYDSYLKIAEIKKITKTISGKVTMKRHLFWRYSLIIKEEKI